MQFEKSTLYTDKVALIPLEANHLPQLLIAGQDPKIWQWLFENYCQSAETIETWFTDTAQFNAKQQLVFATFDKASQTLVGTTRFFRLDPINRSLEIGHTFINPQWQRSHINTHAKYAMLRFAFEQLGCVRVSIITNQHNQQSRSAITRLGAHFEGVIRKIRLLPNGEYRSSAQFSITDDDWPDVKQTLEYKMKESQ
ncbi:GNAT family N-acetyltransferase [Pseudoalteromonas tunicata]|jgi:RimJ/RimL family protein N-acetyltransferase|uniref:Acetyltransferase, GNAT family protein n=1 Tax=Pseudoalteromonas tunicata D2 TaxID=87626 RepID=A4C7S1_9GAMM|nr:GNAT family protein [Pseudoalteromonas tunicata]ATC93141.1 hypothetical protein PTUN_a0330 [Pseudoalteromonas tunicata]AXT32213.1 N-acetyltransferase [Pseudoalteromonas tunicata]EAR28636.1 acetyltransferase, GNAT family protein [Pseudoalteromonas tunicata D2]